MLVDYRRNQAQLIEAPPSTSGDIAADAVAARALVQRVLGSGRTLLEAEEARSLLAAYGIAVRAARQVEPEPYAAASAAEKIGYPVALKIVSPDSRPASIWAACVWTCAAPCRCATPRGACSAGCSAPGPPRGSKASASRPWRCRSMRAS